MFLLNVVQNNQEIIKSLQEKVGKSEALVKSMEEKVISIQGDQMEFLNNVITHMEWAVGIGVTIIVAFAGVVGWLINRSNEKAKKTMDEATEKMKNAIQKMDEAEKKMKDAIKQTEKADTFINNADETMKKLDVYKAHTEGNIAELNKSIDEKLASLKVVEEKTSYLISQQDARLLLENASSILLFSSGTFGYLSSRYSSTEGDQEFQKLYEGQKQLEEELAFYKSQFEFSELKDMNEVVNTYNNFLKECADFSEEVRNYRKKVIENKGTHKEII